MHRLLRHDPKRRPVMRILPLALAGAALANACAKNDAAPTTTTAKVLETLATTSTEPVKDPTLATSTIPTTTTTRVTTTTAPEVKGTFTIKPSNVPAGYPYQVAGSPETPTLTWDIKIEPGQKVSVRGPAPGTDNVELSTVAAGAFPLCPGALANNLCNAEPKTYTYTVDVKNPDGSVFATNTATLRVSR